MIPTDFLEDVVEKRLEESGLIDMVATLKSTGKPVMIRTRREKEAINLYDRWMDSLPGVVEGLDVKHRVMMRRLGKRIIVEKG